MREIVLLEPDEAFLSCLVGLSSKKKVKYGFKTPPDSYRD
jgi:hypothetical protein